MRLPPIVNFLLAFVIGGLVWEFIGFADSVAVEIRLVAAICSLFVSWAWLAWMDAREWANRKRSGENCAPCKGITIKKL